MWVTLFSAVRVHQLLPAIVSLGAAVRQCYFPSWAVYRPDAGKFDVGNIDLNGCSVIDYAFGQITNNQLATFDWQDESKLEIWHVLLFLSA